MKLRLRSLDSRETLKIEIPDLSSLHQLKETIFGIISASSSSSPSISLHLSLNRKDEIHASSPQDSLQSLGITGGDLIFYTLNPYAFSPETLVHKPYPNETLSTVQDTAKNDTGDVPSIPEAEKMQTLESVEAEAMDTVDGSSKAVIAEGNYVPSYTKRTLRELLGEDVSDLKILIFGFHAVMLESGFICVDQGSGSSYFMDKLPLGSSGTMSLRYSLPEILTKDSGASVLLKFQTLGHLVNVYGSLMFDSSFGVHRVCLDKCKFAKPLELLLVNMESKMSDFDGHDDTQVFELWKMVKDGLAYPLLIDICENAGLEPPPSFMRLPTELKLMILEYTPAVDLAKMACTCKELRYLSSNNELWKNKFEDEFPLVTAKVKSYKELFTTLWSKKKNRVQVWGPIDPTFTILLRANDVNRYGIPSIRGGRNDMLPGFGAPFHSFLPRRSFIPPCHNRGLRRI